MTTTAETLALLKDTMGGPSAATLTKAFTQSASPTQGLTFYDLEAPAKTLVPVVTPLRNRIPRVSGGRGIQANWKAITGINVGAIQVGIGEGRRGGVIATQVNEYMAAFRGLGLEDYVTFEAEMAAEGFDDLRARAVQGLLRALMIGEEKLILGGNGSLALGITPTPALALSAATGTLSAAATISVKVAALTLDGYMSASVAGGVPGRISRTNADGSSDSYGGGTAQPSAAASLTTPSDASNTHAIAATVEAVPGAVAYAWFWGAAGSEVLGAITTINSVEITASAAGSQAASALAGDNSANALVFDGLLTQVVKSGAGYVSAQPTGSAGTGTPLTSGNDGGIAEIDTALQWFWDNWRLSPTTIWVSSQEQKNIRKKILNAGATAAQRFVFASDQARVVGGSMAVGYLNPFTLDGAGEIPIRLHPNLPPGTLLFDTEALPYQLSGVADILRMLCRRDYYQMEWPPSARRYEYGVYADEVLQNYAPFAFGMITNIANG